MNGKWLGFDILLSIVISGIASFVIPDWLAAIMAGLLSGIFINLISNSGSKKLVSYIGYGIAAGFITVFITESFLGIFSGAVVGILLGIIWKISGNSKKTAKIFWASLLGGFLGSLLSFLGIPIVDILAPGLIALFFGIAVIFQD